MAETLTNISYLLPKLCKVSTESAVPFDNPIQPSETKTTAKYFTQTMTNLASSPLRTEVEVILPDIQWVIKFKKTYMVTPAESTKIQLF